MKRVFSSDASCTIEMLERSTISLCPRAAAAACSISIAPSATAVTNCEETRGVAREFGGGGVLLDRGRGDRAEHRLHVLDHADDLVHRGDQLGGVVLQLADPPGDLVGRLLGLDRQRLDLVGDHREAAAGSAGAGGFDLGVERQQIGLLGDRRNHVDDVADLAGRLFEAVEAAPGGARDLMDLRGQGAGMIDLPGDLGGGGGQFLGRAGKLAGVALGVARLPRQRLAALADRFERVHRSAGALVDRGGGALDAADHGAQVGLDQVDGFADDVEARPGRRLGLDRRRLDLRESVRWRAGWRRRRSRSCGSMLGSKVTGHGTSGVSSLGSALHCQLSAGIARSYR